jgi:C-terminal processing protease CtpA/Prc
MAPNQLCCMLRQVWLRSLQAIIEAESAGVDGYLIDLRNNPGGVFEEAIAMASYFLDSDGPDMNIVETVRTSDAMHHNIIDSVWTVGMLPPDLFSRHAWGLTSRPVVILTNRGSASASEVWPIWIQASAPWRPAPRVGKAAHMYL